MSAWGVYGTTSRTRQPGFMARRMGDESVKAQARVRSDRLRRGCCPDCGRPLRLEGVPVVGVVTLACRCGAKVTAEKGSRLYRLVREGAVSGLGRGMP